MKYVRANIYQDMTKIIRGYVLARPITDLDWNSIFNGSHPQVWPWLRDIRWNLADELRAGRYQ